MNYNSLALIQGFTTGLVTSTYVSPLQGLTANLCGVYKHKNYSITVDRPWNLSGKVLLSINPWSCASELRQEDPVQYLRQKQIFSDVCNGEASQSAAPTQVNVMKKRVVIPTVRAVLTCVYWSPHEAGVDRQRCLYTRRNVQKIKTPTCPLSPHGNCCVNYSVLIYTFKPKFMKTTRKN